MPDRLTSRSGTHVAIHATGLLAGGFAVRRTAQGPAAPSPLLAPSAPCSGPDRATDALFDRLLAVSFLTAEAVDLTRRAVSTVAVFIAGSALRGSGWPW